jgi:hypothetical protein
MYQKPALSDASNRDDSRIEDIKTKLERYRREREDLEKIRQKF